MAQDYTAKFKVDISDLKKNIADANRDIKLANATFKSETAGMEKWEDDADGVAAKLKQLGTVLKSQETILENYREQLRRQEKASEESGEKVDELKKKLKELADNGVDKASDEYKQYEAELKSAIKAQESAEKQTDNLRIKVLNQEATVKKTEKAIRDFTSAEDKLGDEARDTADDVKKLDDSIEDAGEKSDKADGKLAKLGSTLATGLAAGVAAVTAAVASGITAFAKMTSSAAEYADEINTMSKVTGMGTDDLQAYKYAAELVDVSLDTLSGSMAKNVKSMSNAANGSAKYADAYKKLGIAVTDSNGELRDGEKVFWEAIDALGAIENETERDAIAMQLFGKSARDLNPLIEEGSARMAELKQEAQDMGAVMSQDSLDALNDFDDSMQRLKGGAEAAKNALGTILLPVLQDLADDGVELIGEFTRGINEAGGDWSKISDVIGDTVGKLSDRLIEEIPKIVEIGSEIVGSLADSLISAAPKLAQVAFDLIEKLAGKFLDALPKILDVGVEIILTIADGLSKTLPNLLKKITTEVIPKLIRSLLQAAPKLLKAAVELWKSLIKALPEIVKELARQIPNLIRDIGKFLKEGIPLLLKSGVELFKSLLTALGQVAIELVKAIPDTIAAIGKAVVDSIGGVLKWITGAGDEVDEQAQRVQEAVNKIYEGHQERMSQYKEEHDAIKENADTWDEFIEGQKQTANEELGKVGYYEGLLEELQLLVDKNGDVKKGYEERVEFIENELQKGFDIEIDNLDDLIDKNGKVKGSIWEVIEAKKAEIIIAQKEAAYEEALKRQSEIYKGLADTQGKIEKAKEEFTNAVRNYKEADLELGMAIEKGDKEAENSIRVRMAAAKAAAGASTLELTFLKANEEEYRNQLADTEYAIQDYQIAVENAQKGNYEAINTYTREEVKTFKETGDEKKAELERQITDEKNHIDTLEKLYKETGEEQFKDQKDLAEKKLKQAEDDLAAYNKSQKKGTEKGFEEVKKVLEKGAEEAEEIGKGFVGGLSKGISDTLSNQELMDTASNIAAIVKSAFQNMLETHSPSRFTERLGKYFVEGLALGIRENTESAVNQVGAFGKKITAKAKNMLNMGVDGLGGATSIAGYSGVYGVGQKTVNFTQINNSPKALSRLEIYRETQNILSLAKEVI